MKNRRIIIRSFGGPEVLELIDEPLPIPGQNQVRVRVLACGVSYADILMREGLHPETPRLPFTPGWDLVGVVDPPGHGGGAWTAGNLVGALPVTGAYSDYICLDVNSLVPLPAGLDPPVAVCIIFNYLTAYQLLHRAARVQQGDRVLIHSAAGGIGSALVELGRLAGLTMIGTASATNHEPLRQAGVIPIDYRNQDFVAFTNELTGGGVDFVFDGIGGHHLTRSLNATRPGGRVISYGLTTSIVEKRTKNLPASRFSGTLDIARRIVASTFRPDGRRITLYSVQRLRRQHPDWFRNDTQTLYDLLSAGKIEPLVAVRLPLNKVRFAHESLEHGGVKGKIVLVP